ncbi:MAG: glycosyltransferase family 4 protein [Acidobacteriota bacterium]
MKILNIILDGRMAGPQVRIANMSGRLKETYNIDTLVVYPDKNSDSFTKLLKKNGVRHKSINIRRLSKSIFGIVLWVFTFFPDVIKLIKIIKKEDPDIIHCNGAWQWKGIVAGSFAGKKLVWHLNDTYLPFFVKIVFNILSRFVDVFISEGKKVTEYYLSSIKRNRVFEIQAPFDIGRFSPDQTDRNKEIDSFPGRRIVTSGNVNYCKGLEYFIEAANILNMEFDDLQFFVVGGLYESQKQYIKMLKKKVKSLKLTNVHFMGYMEDVPSVLKSADIYVCSSITEASPQSVWEAMAMGKAIVSTDVGSVSDFIVNGESGFIIPVKTPRLLSEKIELLLRDSDLGEKFGRNAQLSAHQNLSDIVISEKHFSVYKKLSE